MNERTTLEKIAPSVEEAIAEGLAELGLTAEAVDVEILDGGSRGLFGVGSRQARVRLTVKTPPSGTELNVKKTETIQENPLSGSHEEPVAEVSEEAFNVLDDNLLFISRQTVAELLEKMNIPAHIEVRYGELDEEGDQI